MTNQPFFAKRGDAFIPNAVSNGPWDPNSMHGRVVIGLLALPLPLVRLRLWRGLLAATTGRLWGWLLLHLVQQPVVVVLSALALWQAEVLGRLV